MAKFSLQFDCDSAAFTDGIREHEVARILRGIAEKLEYGEVTYPSAHRPVRDLNGNRIGSFVLLEDV